MLQRQLEFSVAYKAIAGAREYQEDSIKIWRPEGGGAANAERGSLLAALSDGMGGHVSGEVASRLVCESAIEYFQSVSGDLTAKLEGALLASNESLEKAIRADPRLSGMGCTVVLAYLDGQGMRWASVGDSQLLMFRNNLLYRLNDDHSLGALLDKQAEARLITHEEAHASPHRHSLRSAMTGGTIAIADVERDPLQLQPGDWVIVASDGLETLSGTEIASIIGLYGSRDHPLDIAEKLLDSITRRKVPTQDNASVIAIRVQEASEDKTQMMGSSSQHGDRPTLPIAALPAEAAPPKRGHVIGQVVEGGMPQSGPPRQRSRSPALLLVAAAALLAAVGFILYSKMLNEAPAAGQAEQARPSREAPGAVLKQAEPAEGVTDSQKRKPASDNGARLGPGRPN